MTKKHIKRPCRFCGQQVTSDQKAVDFCRGCYFSGRTKAEEPRIAAVLAAANAIPNAKAELMHTGGGCWGMEVHFTDGRFAFATEAYWDEQHKQWQAESNLPERPEDRWALSISKSEETFFEGEEPLVWKVGITDAELLSALATA